VQEYTASLRTAFTEARGLIKDGDPLRAMAAFDEFFRAEPPEGDFDSEDPNAVDASYTLYSLLARMHWEAARHADAIGRWERAAECYTKAAGLIVGPAEKVAAVYPRFAEPYENEKRKMLRDMETHADEIAALKAKDRASYTNDDYTALDQAQTLERGVEEANRAIAYYAGRTEAAARDVAFYGQPYAEGASAKIRMVQEQIDKYRGGRGDRAKWVEGVISDYQKQLPGYATTLEDQVSFAYRLTVLSPGSRTAPALLEWLKARAKAAALEEGGGEVTDEARAAIRDALKDAERREAELRRAIAASRPKK
jgi:tetratricopeptide (TPR) repeat protein